MAKRDRTRTLFSLLGSASLALLVVHGLDLGIALLGAVVIWTTADLVLTSAEEAIARANLRRERAQRWTRAIGR